MKSNIKASKEGIDYFEKVIEEAACMSGTSKAVIVGRSQKSEVIIIRHSCMLALHNLGLSQSEIGRLFDRDHSTVKHAIASRSVEGKGAYVLRMSSAIVDRVKDEP